MTPRRLLLLPALLLAACQPDERAATSPAAPDAPAGSASAAATTSSRATIRPETRKFRDWLAVCDNANTCVAFGPAVDGNGGWIRVALDAGPAARAQITAGLVDRAAGPDGLALSVDGRRFALADLPIEGSEASQGVIRDAGPEVIDALAKGRRLTLGDDVALSPSGAAAALLWIDERQGRLNTTTALMRRGAKPASTVPAAPPLPVVAPAPAVAQTSLPRPALPAAFEARADVRQCRADTTFNPDLQREITVDRLSPAQELWGVPCFVGAYNFGLRYFVTGPNGADPRPVRFPTSREPTDEVVNGAYEPASRTLSAFNKGRGVGDCGVETLWTWTGRDFALTSETEMRECWGVPSALWSTTWRSR
ncbi:DUF1176 domain-containing protein [Brevundimonas sp. NPDC090276]|uniref:DUF1176 domain-containing protein n=1 Tax=Brevundimonas sp. NPDC090276 TaxID=3363956 RepID=UPI00383BAF97